MPPRRQDDIRRRYALFVQNDTGGGRARAGLNELNAITRADGRPYLAAHSLAHVTQAMSDGWFERWHRSD